MHITVAVFAMSTMNAWEGWYDGPSSSDDDSLFTPVKLKKRGRMTVPMTVQELHEETVRRGEEYRWRKLARRKKREEARQKEEEPLPGKYFSENEEEAEFTDDDDLVCLDRDLSMEQRGFSPAPSSGDEFEFEFPAETRCRKDFKLTEKKGRLTKKHCAKGIDRWLTVEITEMLTTQQTGTGLNTNSRKKKRIYVV